MLLDLKVFKVKKTVNSVLFEVKVNIFYFDAPSWTQCSNTNEKLTKRQTILLVTNTVNMILKQNNRIKTHMHTENRTENLWFFVFEIERKESKTKLTMESMALVMLVQLVDLVVVAVVRLRQVDLVCLVQFLMRLVAVEEPDWYCLMSPAAFYKKNHFSFAHRDSIMKQKNLPAELEQLFSVHQDLEAMF